MTKRSTVKTMALRNHAAACGVTLFSFAVAATAFAGCSSSGDDSTSAGDSGSGNDSSSSLDATQGGDGSGGGARCGSDQTTCGTECVNLDHDNANCGACGNACNAGEVCSQSKCGLACAAPLTMCTGVVGLFDAGPAPDAGDSGATLVGDAGIRAPYCAGLQSDNQNCGTCGNVCPGVLACRDGSCTHYSGVTGAWQVVASEPGAGYGGFSDFSPPGYASFYGTDYQGAFFRYDEAPVDAWTTLASSPEVLTTNGDFSGPAWVGGKLYAFGVDEILEYDIASGNWNTHLTATTTHVGNEGQHTHDDSGHVYAIKDDGNLLKYDIAANTLTTIALSAPLAGEHEPRLEWDTATHLLYAAPAYDATELDSIDPATGNVVLLSPVPGTQMSDIFCADRNGHLYANGGDDATTLYQYVIATNTWTLLSNNPPPFSGANQGSCTVTSDGWLYYTDGFGSIAKLQLF